MFRHLSLLIFVIFIGCNNQDIARTNYLTENNLKGNILEFSEMQYFDIDSPVNKYNSKTTVKLNDEGNIIEEKHMGLKTDYKYENGWQIITHRNEELNIFLNTYKTKRSYEHSIYKICSYSDEGELFYYNEKKFDSNKRIIWEREQNSGIHLNTNYRRIYRYLDNFKTEIISYNENSNKIKPTVRSIETVDKFGNIISVKTTLLNRENPKTEQLPEEVYKYKYDNKGNWIIKYWYTGKDSVPFMKNTRTFVYR